jgi:hypothetical protein
VAGKIIDAYSRADPDPFGVAGGPEKLGRLARGSFSAGRRPPLLEPAA